MFTEPKLNVCFFSDLDKMQNFYQTDVETRQVSKFTAYCDEEWIRALLLVSLQAASPNQSFMIVCFYFTLEIFLYEHSYIL